MLATLATIFSSVLIGAAVVQFGMAIYFRIRFERKQMVRLPAEKQFGTAVLMCVRGCDPSLRLSLISVLQQDFVDFEVHVVVDHRTDTAWDVVQAIKREFDPSYRLHIHELQSPENSCGLKCSSLVQGLKHISDSVKYLVLLDADVATHPSWMAELLGPLDFDPEIGLVTGNQWFEPPAGSTWGALVRSSWNAGALVPTIIFKNPWAGSCAMRMADVQAADLPGIWQNSVVDDGPLRKAFQQLGKKVFFSPSLIMVNRENCTFRYTLRWVSRMLTWSRLHESTFFLSVIHATFSNTVMMATFAWLIYGVAIGSSMVTTISASALAISGILSVLAYLLVRSAVSRSCQLRGERLQTLGIIRFSKLLLSVPVTQLIYGISCLTALSSRQVKWREITYEINGNADIKMLKYQPFVQTNEQIRSNVSI